MSFLLEYGIWILPPLLGAFIGYATNTLAVKMLFRPHKKWKLGKLSFPLTPGVIPRNREELSQNIAEITANQLLHPDTLQEQVSSSKSSLSSILEKGIQKRIQDLKENISQNSFTEKLPKELQSPFIKLYSSAKTQVQKFLKEWTHSPEFQELLNGRIPELFQKFFQKSSQEGNSSEKLEKLLKLFIPVSETPTTLTMEKPTEKKATEEKASKSQAQSLLASPLFQEPLENWIPQELADLILEIIEEIYPSILQKLKKMMFNLKLNQEFSLHFRFILTDYIQNLNIAQQFLVGVWGLEERIEKDLPKLIDQAIDSIFDSLESRKKDIFRWLTKESSAFLEQPLQNFSNSITENRITRLQSILNHPRTLKLISQILQLFQNSSTKTLDLREFSDEIQSALHSLFQLIEEHLDLFILPPTLSDTENNIPLPDSKLDSKIANSDKTSYSDSLSKEISAILSQEILASLQKKSFWESFPIQNIIQKKMETFSTKEIENILLKIMQKHFKWIYLLGAILGFLIGCLQLFWNLS